MTDNTSFNQNIINTIKAGLTAQYRTAKDREAEREIYMVPKEGASEEQIKDSVQALEELLSNILDPDHIYYTDGTRSVEEVSFMGQPTMYRGNDTGAIELIEELAVAMNQPEQERSEQTPEPAQEEAEQTPEQTPGTEQSSTPAHRPIISQERSDELDRAYQEQERQRLIREQEQIKQIADAYEVGVTQQEGTYFRPKETATAEELAIGEQALRELTASTLATLNVRTTNPIIPIGAMNAPKMFRAGDAQTRSVFGVIGQDVFKYQNGETAQETETKTQETSETAQPEGTVAKDTPIEPTEDIFKMTYKDTEEPEPILYQAIRTAAVLDTLFTIVDGELRGKTDVTVSQINNAKSYAANLLETTDIVENKQVVGLKPIHEDQAEFIFQLMEATKTIRAMYQQFPDMDKSPEFVEKLFAEQLEKAEQPAPTVTQTKTDPELENINGTVVNRTMPDLDRPLVDLSEPQEGIPAEETSVTNDDRKTGENLKRAYKNLTSDNNELVFGDMTTDELFNAAKYAALTATGYSVNNIDTTDIGSKENSFILNTALDNLSDEEKGQLMPVLERAVQSSLVTVPPMKLAEMYRETDLGMETDENVWRLQILGTRMDEIVDDYVKGDAVIDKENIADVYDGMMAVLETYDDNDQNANIAKANLQKEIEAYDTENNLDDIEPQDANVLSHRIDTVNDILKDDTIFDTYYKNLQFFDNNGAMIPQTDENGVVRPDSELAILLNIVKANIRTETTLSKGDIVKEDVVTRANELLQINTAALIAADLKRTGENPTQAAKHVEELKNGQTFSLPQGTMAGFTAVNVNKQMGLLNRLGTKLGKDSTVIKKLYEPIKNIDTLAARRFKKDYSKTPLAKACLQKFGLGAMGGAIAAGAGLVAAAMAVPAAPVIAGALAAFAGFRMWRHRKNEVAKAKAEGKPRPPLNLKQIALTSIALGSVALGMPVVAMGIGAAAAAIGAKAIFKRNRDEGYKTTTAVLRTIPETLSALSGAALTGFGLTTAVTEMGIIPTAEATQAPVEQTAETQTQDATADTQTAVQTTRPEPQVAVEPITQTPVDNVQPVQAPSAPQTPTEAPVDAGDTGSDAAGGDDTDSAPAGTTQTAAEQPVRSEEPQTTAGTTQTTAEQPVRSEEPQTTAGTTTETRYESGDNPRLNTAGKPTLIHTAGKPIQIHTAGQPVLIENTWGQVPETREFEYVRPAETPAQQPAETPTQPAETPAQQPAETPAQQPAETPAQQPAETPAQQPAEAPAQQPAETPAQQPAEAPQAPLSVVDIFEAIDKAAAQEGAPSPTTQNGLPNPAYKEWLTEFMDRPENDELAAAYNDINNRNLFPDDDYAEEVSEGDTPGNPSSIANNTTQEVNSDTGETRITIHARRYASGNEITTNEVSTGTATEVTEEGAEEATPISQAMQKGLVDRKEFIFDIQTRAAVLDTPAHHTYDTAAHELAQARLNGEGVYDAAGRPTELEYLPNQLDNALNHIRTLENTHPEFTGADGTSNADILMYKLTQMNKLVSDDTDLIINGQKVSVAEAFGIKLPDGSIYTPTDLRTDLLVGDPLKFITPEQMSEMLSKVEASVDTTGHFTRDIVGFNETQNASYRVGGDAGFKIEPVVRTDTPPVTDTPTQPTEATPPVTETTEATPPVTDTPAQSTEVTASGTETPAQSTEANASGTETPAQPTESTASVTETPAQSTEATASGTETPAQPTEATASGTETPPQSTEATPPVTETTEATPPVTDTPAQSTETPASVAETTEATTPAWTSAENAALAAAIASVGVREKDTAVETLTDRVGALPKAPIAQVPQTPAEPSVPEETKAPDNQPTDEQPAPMTQTPETPQQPTEPQQPGAFFKFGDNSGVTAVNPFTSNGNTFVFKMGGKPVQPAQSISSGRAPMPQPIKSAPTGQTPDQTETKRPVNWMAQTGEMVKKFNELGQFVDSIRKPAEKQTTETGTTMPPAKVDQPKVGDRIQIGTDDKGNAIMGTIAGQITVQIIKQNRRDGMCEIRAIKDGKPYQIGKTYTKSMLNQTSNSMYISNAEASLNMINNIANQGQATINIVNNINTNRGTSLIMVGNTVIGDTRGGGHILGNNPNAPRKGNKKTPNIVVNINGNNNNVNIGDIFKDYSSIQAAEKPALGNQKETEIIDVEVVSSEVSKPTPPIIPPMQAETAETPATPALTEAEQKAVEAIVNPMTTPTGIESEIQKDVAQSTPQTGEPKKNILSGMRAIFAGMASRKLTTVNKNEAQENTNTENRLLDLIKKTGGKNP